MVFDSVDVRHAWRKMRSRPAMTGMAAGMLGLGIGLTTAMFTVVDSLLLRPVPFRDADQLAQISMFTERGGRVAVSAAVLEAWRTSSAFKAVEGVSPGTTLIEAHGRLASMASARVSPGLFDMLGVQPVRGRLFSAEEGRAASDDVVLLSEDVWRTMYAAAPDLVGGRITMDGESKLVVGVLPSRFRFPSWDTTVWMPIDYQTPPPLLADARPIAYVRFAAAVPRADALRLATDAAHGADGSTTVMRATPIPLAGVELDQYYRRAIPLLIGGLVLVFLALCANVCGLLLAQMAARRHELGLYCALGASRGRLLRQALLESVILGLLGLTVGVATAWAFVSVARAFLPEALLIRTLNPVAFDVRALFAAFAAGALATLITALLPTWIGTRLDPAALIRVTDRGGTGARATGHSTRALLITEIAFACMLLVGATLLVRSFANLARADRGLQAQGVIVARVILPATDSADRLPRIAAASVLENVARGLPAVQQVALSVGRPPRGGAIHFSNVRSDMPGALALGTAVESYQVTRDFFSLYGIRLLRGRTFQPGEPETSTIIGERLAAMLWPGLDPIGRSFRRDHESFYVVGLVNEISLPSLDPSVDRPEFYCPLVPGGGSFWINMECGTLCPDSAVIRQRLLTATSGATVVDVGSAEEAYLEELARPRATAALAFAFASIALVAAAGGLFSVQSYAVRRRRREFGIRISFGASPAQIAGLVLREGFMVAAIGTSLGAVGAWALTRGLASLEYGVAFDDPWIWTIVCGVLALTTLLACSQPARKAAQVDPIDLVKEE